MPYKKTNIPLSDTGHFPQLLLDYIGAEEKLKKFYSYLPLAGSFKEAMANRSSKPLNRALLREVILDQYNSRIKAPLADFQATNSNIELLSDDNTFTVCTGHQLCLFTGPMYFIYKIITTINLSEELKSKYPGNNFVPVYWMASEDHDFEEIRSIHLFGKTLSWENPEAEGAVGRLSTSSLNKMLEELSTVLGDSATAQELIALFENAYLKHPNLADATRYLVHALFGAYGLVIIDPDDARLKKEFIDIIKDDISNQTNYKIVNKTIAELEEAGYKAQVNPREINVFKLDNDRVRIGQASAEVLDLNPEEYSPNVVLRPLYQQRILPNIAYVGGPGELAYWFEYKAMFDHHGITFPVLIPRNFALLTDEKTNQQLQKFNLSVNGLFKDTEMLIREFISKAAGSGISLKEQEEKIAVLYAGISEKAALVDPSLKGTVEAELQKTVNGLKNIESRLLRSEKQKQETSINQLRKLKEKLFPEGNLQERYDNFAPYYLKYGKDMIPSLKATFKAFEYEMLIIEMN
ncbi:MAG: bacillithiol biosynthesis cysteine-adding enzyme BshC [Bacteroidetes bacterium]|nr:bacillithiol biosynthesis cysteine-adding enzyme BshC [Bacteroidota bacterium]